jgi:hypothetical protein
MGKHRDKSKNNKVCRMREQSRKWRIIRSEV